MDAALDAHGGGALPALVELAGTPDRVVTIADYQGAQATGARFSGGMGTSRAMYALADVGREIEAGRFALEVFKTYPLEQIADAHRDSEAGHLRGKLEPLPHRVLRDHAVKEDYECAPPIRRRSPVDVAYVRGECVELGGAPRGLVRERGEGERLRARQPWRKERDRAERNRGE